MSEMPGRDRSDPRVALFLGSAFLGIYAHGGFFCGLNEAGVFPSHIASMMDGKRLICHLKHEHPSPGLFKNSAKKEHYFELSLASCTEAFVS